MKYCSNCGSKIENKVAVAKFCPNCGSSLSIGSTLGNKSSEPSPEEVVIDEIPNLEKLDVDIDINFEGCRKTTIADIMKEDSDPNQISRNRGQLKKIEPKENK
jgi:hypothetical protein